MTETDVLRLELRRALDQAETWLSGTPHLGLDTGAGIGSDLDSDVSVIRKLRTRAASSLINVGLVGEFSSGKSFLVGALQGRMEYAPVIDDEGMTWDQYIGLLPSATKAATSCPATVVPVDVTDDIDASGNGLLRVRFTDNEWATIGNSPLPAVVAAYATRDPATIVRGRSAEHRERTVAEVEILLANPMLPAKFFDLPGFGSPHAIHDEIAMNAWIDADCFIYITQATSTLSQADLNLINSLYNHHLDSQGKRVIWVMTGIDRPKTANYEGQAEWKDTLQADNAYMRENFKPLPGGADLFFGPEGFIAVSPAWEALGRWHIAQGDKARGEKLIAASRMGRLRRILTDLIESGTGHRHISRIAVEARTVIIPLHRALVGLLDSARLPLEKLAGERDDLGRRLSQLKSAVATVSEDLDRDLRTHLHNMSRAFRGLSDHLHAELDHEIGDANLLKEKESQRIDLLKAQILKEWANRTVVPLWSAEFVAFTDGALSAIRATVRDIDPSAEIGHDSSGIDLEQLTVPASERYRTGTQDVIQNISAFVGISTSLATVLAASVGIITGPFLVVPAGVTLLAGILYGGIRRHKMSSSVLDVLRQDSIDALDEAAKHYQEAFVGAAQLQGIEIIDRAVELLSERGDDLALKIMLVESRLSEPDNADRGELVSRLEPYCRSGELLLTQLKEFSR